MEILPATIPDGLVNEMKIVADRMGIDIHEVIRAAATKPFGFAPYYPGPGLGGHCIPIDPFYLTWKAREYGINTRFIELAGEVNSNMPQWVVGKVAAALNERSKAVKGSKILVLGIAYKKNIDDMRESPAVAIMALLHEKGAEIAYADPHVPVFPKMRKHHFDLASVTLNPRNHCPTRRHRGRHPARCLRLGTHQATCATDCGYARRVSGTGCQCGKGLKWASPISLPCRSGLGRQTS